jgi:hypothetical protein
MGAGRNALAQGFFTSRVHLIGEAADHLIESFLFNGDSRVDEFLESGRGVRRDVDEFHGNRFGDGNLHVAFNEGLKMYVSFVLFLGCKVGLPGSDKECFDQLFEAVFKATDVVNVCCGESSMLVGDGWMYSSCFKQSEEIFGFEDFGVTEQGFVMHVKGVKYKIVSKMIFDRRGANCASDSE